MTAPTAPGSAARKPMRTQTELLEAILGRLDAMERRLDAMSQVIDQVPGVVAVVTDTVDERLQAAQAKGVDVDSRLEALGELLVKLTETKTLAVLGQLMEHLPKLEPVLASLDSVPGLVAMSVDMFDDLVAQATAHGYNFEDLVKSALTAAGKLTLLLDSPEVKALFSSGVFAPETVGVLGKVALALRETQSGPAPEAGLWKAFRSTRSKETRRALGFLLTLAERFGEQLGNGAPALAHKGNDVPRLPNNS